MNYNNTMTIHGIHGNGSDGSQGPVLSTSGPTVGRWIYPQMTAPNPQGMSQSMMTSGGRFGYGAPTIQAMQ